MTARRFLQERILLKYYAQGAKEWKRIIIKAETVKVTKKQSSDTFTASDDVDPYALAFGEKSYELQLSSIDPDQKTYFNYIWNSQQASKMAYLPRITLYYYHNTTGAVTTEQEFRECYIEEITEENHKPFDVKIGALERLDAAGLKKLAEKAKTTSTKK